MGSYAVSLEESLFISFKQVIFSTDIETQSGILYLCELKDDERIFLALVPSLAMIEKNPQSKPLL